MALREIIEIDEDRCDGCGACAQGCPEGALRIIDGKARLVGESLCDGLGACLGECPRGAITVTRREAAAYDEAKVMEGMVKLGPKVIAAHLEHLSHHGQSLFEGQALAWLKAKGLEDPRSAQGHGEEAQGECQGGGCPGSASRRFTPRVVPGEQASGGPAQASALSAWPIQLHLVNPGAPQFQDARLLIAADCTAFALGSFHPGLLRGRSLVIACPKLDDRQGYVEKLAALFKAAREVDVAIMEVPCCGGLLKLAMDARAMAGVGTAITLTIVGIQGQVKEVRKV